MEGSPMSLTAETTGDLIDRQSSVPYYQQLGAVLERRLESGQIDANSRLPSENELCKEFGLSRATVRQALQMLESRGVVHRVAGRGVYAGDRDSERGWVIAGGQGFLENALTHQNRSVTTEVLRSGYAVLPGFACRALNIADGTKGFELVRLRYLDGAPAVFSINYSPPGVAKYVAKARDVLAGNASLSELLTRSGYPLGGAHRSVRAVTASPEIAAALKIRKTTPVVQIQSTSWTAEEFRYDVYETYVRTDVVPLEVNVSTAAR
jgi:GntR family transcriptional regulator